MIIRIRMVTTSQRIESLYKDSPTIAGDSFGSEPEMVISGSDSQVHAVHADGCTSVDHWNLSRSTIP